ncbi:MAG: hypothetical protein JW888_03375 [Pirellulales bacterium]|nr:hypothetical protein [Pirellulales bacterium]
MTKNRSSARKTKRIVRAPATKFGHLQKKAKSIRDAGRTTGKQRKP